MGRVVAAVVCALFVQSVQSGTQGTAGDSRPTSASAASEAALHSTIVANIPVLLAAPQSTTSQTPLVIMYHGFGSPNSPESLAKALPPIEGAITVYPSLPLLGVRMPPGGADELIRRQENDYVGRVLYPAILGAAHELPQIVASLSKSYGLSKSAPLILFGFSAGGAAAMLSLTEADVHPRAVLVINSPMSVLQAVKGFERQTGRAYTWTAKAKVALRHYDVEKSATRIARLNPKAAILILQSEADPGLSVANAQAAATALQKAASRYDSEPDVAAVTLRGAGHHVFESPRSTSGSPPGPMIRAWIRRHAFT
jgi:dienelactone hydrolase